jgi:hypothetical protein
MSPNFRLWQLDHPVIALASTPGLVCSVLRVWFSGSRWLQGPRGQLFWSSACCLLGSGLPHPPSPPTKRPALLSCPVSRKLTSLSSLIIVPSQTSSYPASRIPPGATVFSDQRHVVSPTVNSNSKQNNSHLSSKLQFGQHFHRHSIWASHQIHH